MRRPRSTAGRAPGRPLPLLPRPLSGAGTEVGMIVLAPLVAFTVLLVVMVVGGRLLYGPPPDPYDGQATPVLYLAATPAPVVREGVEVARLQPGDSVWALRLVDGTAVVYPDGAGSPPVGVATVVLVAPRDGAR